MVLRKSVLVILMGIMIVCLSAVTYDELEKMVLYFKADDNVMTNQQINEEFGMFIAGNQDLVELENAHDLWLSFDLDAVREFVEDRHQKNPLDFKYRWLNLYLIEDPFSRINQARELIRDHGSQSQGYKVLTTTYLTNYPFAMFFADPALAEAALKGDLDLFITYGELFKEDAYALLARIFYHMEKRELRLAKKALSEAADRGAIWLMEIDFSRVVPIDKYHELMRHYVELLIANKELEDRDFKIQQAAEYLVNYYFETLKDYPALIELMGNESAFAKSYYFRYVLVSSYYYLQDYSSPLSLIADAKNFADSKAFQDVWINFDAQNAAAVYGAILSGKLHEPINRYLYIRLIQDDEKRLDEIRKLVRSMPKEKYAYQLLSEHYWRYFSNADVNDPNRSVALTNFQKDKNLLDIYYIRFVDDVDALRAYLLTNILQKRDLRAGQTFQKLLDKVITHPEIKAIDKVVADTKNTNLLMMLKEFYLRQGVEGGFFERQDLEKNVVLAFCDALYSFGHGDLLVSELEANPEWWNYPELQYLMVNFYYYQNDFQETIRVLTFMVQQGNIGSTVLKSMEGNPITGHPDWAGLIKNAETMPDPDLEDETYEDIQPYDPTFDEGIELEPELNQTGAIDSNEEDVIGEEVTQATDDVERYKSGIVGKPAPDWLLKNLKGYEIALSDYPGSTIILDFWASWCGPCLSAMPLLDEWVKNDMPENVLVFSINVWEDDPLDAIDYWNENDFEMTMLFGDDDLAEAYQFPGIPYICVIDKDGIVRFEELGYSNSLKALLNSWMRELER
ncbi:MAG: redoxin domain-containing protein [Candidatus Cloacimonadaceae bacterium]|nr:redoxin domain-containing protein [Candidatus Cloacimonadaceae bacterium]